MVSSRLLVVCALLFGTFAHADTGTRARPSSVVGRVVGIENHGGDGVIVTVAVGAELGITKTSRARFREGTTPRLLAGGEAVLVRVDRRTTVLKTRLSPAQVRANKYVQFDR